MVNRDRQIILEPYLASQWSWDRTFVETEPWIKGLLRRRLSVKVVGSHKDIDLHLLRIFA